MNKKSIHEHRLLNCSNMKTKLIFCKPLPLVTCRMYSNDQMHPHYVAGYQNQFSSGNKEKTSLYSSSEVFLHSTPHLKIQSK